MVGILKLLKSKTKFFKKSIYLISNIFVYPQLLQLP